MPVCERCRLDNPPGRDFCAECNYYLRWELTAEQPAAPPCAVPKTLTRPRVPGPHPPRRVRRDPRGGVGLALAVPGASASADRPVVVEAQAGGEAEIAALVRNRGEVVEHYELRVEGIPDGWWTAEPPVVELLPWGTGGTYEATVTIRLQPPRTPEARAGQWPVRVRAIPRATPAEAADAPATLTVLPFGACETQLAPEIVTGRRRGRFDLRVRNAGNATLAVALAASDGEDACRATFAPPAPRLGPGESAAVAMTVRPRRQLWLGRRRDRSLVVSVSPLDGTPAPQPLRAVFRQRAWLPTWLAYAVPAVATAAVVAFTAWPRTAVVPDLSSAGSAFEAQRMLQQAGLALGPAQRGEVNDKVPPGGVIDQSPPAGAKVRRGSRVAVLVALGSDRHAVPNVVGLTLAEADHVLGDHFKLGVWQPTDAPDDAVIRLQRPAAGEERQDGTPVNVSLDAGTAPVPAVVPPSAGKAPAAGQPLAFDDGKNLFLAAPGAAPSPLSTDGRATEASWAPDGATLAYMRWNGQRGRIFVFAPGSYPGHPASGAEGDFHRPAVARDGTAVAFVDRATGGVCIAPLPVRPAAMRCATDSRWAYERVAWTSDGRALLAVARGRQPDAGDGVVRYALPTAAARAADWRPAEAQATLAIAARNVQQIAIAPSGDRLAITLGAAGQPGDVLVGSAAPGAGAPQPVSGASACELAWTADGRLTVAAGPCGGSGAITVLGAGSDRSSIGIGSSPAWRPGEGATP